MKSVRLVQIFRPIKETKRTHSKGYVEDLSTQRGRKRCAKMAVLNLSVLPIMHAGVVTSGRRLNHGTAARTLLSTRYARHFPRCDGGS